MRRGNYAEIGAKKITSPYNGQITNSKAISPFIAKLLQYLQNK
jgi:hypothetical protein